MSLKTKAYCMSPTKERAQLRLRHTSRGSPPCRRCGEGCPSQRCCRRRTERWLTIALSVRAGRFDGGRPPQVEDASGQVNLRSRMSPASTRTASPRLLNRRAPRQRREARRLEAWFPVIDYDRCTNCCSAWFLPVRRLWRGRTAAHFRSRTTTTAKPTARPAHVSVPRPRSCSRNTKRARSTVRGERRRPESRENEDRYLGAARRRCLAMLASAVKKPGAASARNGTPIRH